MYLSHRPHHSPYLQSPHKRGDVPYRTREQKGQHTISPQAWGCTGKLVFDACYGGNLPTSVGMYRCTEYESRTGCQSPHKRGDVPMNAQGAAIAAEISPQAWGCTDGWPIVQYQHGNLPTSVGMYRCNCNRHGTRRESPHKRGDVPTATFFIESSKEISPQAWGCTVVAPRPRQSLPNLPTSVGMYRPDSHAHIGLAQSPHKRGDVPS